MKYPRPFDISDYRRVVLILITPSSNQVFSSKTGGVINYFGEIVLEKHETTILWTFLSKRQKIFAPSALHFMPSSTIFNRLRL